MSFDKMNSSTEDLKEPQVSVDEATELEKALKLSLEMVKDHDNNNKEIDEDDTDELALALKMSLELNDEPVIEPKKKQKKNRCYKCDKKMPLAGRFTCKCNYTFCAKHMYPEEHTCDFDHRSAERDILRKRTKGCIADRMHHRLE